MGKVMNIAAAHTPTFQELNLFEVDETGLQKTIMGKNMSNSSNHFLETAPCRT